MEKKDFCCTCVNPIWRINDLESIIDNAKEISRKWFLKNCNVSETEKQAIKEFPNDFAFYRNIDIFFYTHSAIEHFFK